MVSNSSIVFMIISAIICFGLPIGLVIYFYKKEKIALLAVFCGALAFIVSQVCLRIPILQYLNKQPEVINFVKSNKIIYMILLALSAGIFEEIARFVGMKYMLKNKLSWKNGIAFGIGHGGIEAILLIGIAYVSNIINSFLINSGGFEKIVGSQVPQAGMIKETLINTPSYMFLLGGFERIFAVAFHIALTMIVLEGVMKKKNKYLLYAILIHGAIDFIAVYSTNIFVTEALMGIVAIISLRFSIKSKGKFRMIKEDKGVSI